jgi:hypothetical protein
VPEKLKVVRDRAQELDPQGDFLLLPSVPHQPGWDAVLVMDGTLYFLLMTVGPQRETPGAWPSNVALLRRVHARAEAVATWGDPAEVQGMVDLLGRLNAPPAAKYLCFVMPEEHYRTFAVHPEAWESEKGEGVKCMHADLHDLIQIAVLVDDQQLLPCSQPERDLTPSR